MASFYILIFIILSVCAVSFALFPLRRQKVSIFFLMPLSLLLISLAYGYWGGWTKWQQYRKEQIKQEKIKTLLASFKTPQDLIDKMASQVRQHPKDAKGWYLLGKLYASQARWHDAVNCLKRARDNEPSNDLYTMSYAQYAWQENNNQFNAHIRQLCEQVYAKNPKQGDAIAMLAMDAFMRHDYSKAILLWQNLIKLTSPGSKDRETILKAIAKAKALNH